MNRREGGVVSECARLGGRVDGRSEQHKGCRQHDSILIYDDDEMWNSVFLFLFFFFFPEFDIDLG